MGRKSFLLVCFFLLLSACAPANGGPALTALPSDASLDPTKTATFAPSATFTLIPETLTPVPPTITPLPTIPTFTPTLDVRTIVIATPAPKAECPKENPTLKPDFDLNLNGVLDFLNKGGNINFVINKAKVYPQLGVRKINYQDVNDDTVPEMIFIYTTANNRIGQLVILSCQDNRFVSNLYSLAASGPINLFAIKDINKNGNPEIVITYRGCSGSGCFGFYTYEWNGQKFENITLLAEEIFGLQGINFQDIDENGVDEILLAGDQPGSCCASDEMAWRLKTVVYAWNGTVFSKNYFYFASPQYRFQIIQDGDRETNFGHYSKAFAAYQDAIFSDKLDWWSEEKLDYLLSAYLGGGPHEPIGPAPIVDITEYSRLAAYAYYRMVILHTYLGEMDAAKVKYATLQEKFPASNPGHPYVEMATDFWNAYQSGGKMYDACAAAIAYADAHPEILTPLGGDYHGAQSHTYIPADVCPFQ